MDHSFDLPREPHLSNSILKNRPVPLARTKMKQKHKTPRNDVIPLDGKLIFDPAVGRDPPPPENKTFPSRKKNRSDFVFIKKSLNILIFN